MVAAQFRSRGEKEYTRKLRGGALFVAAWRGQISTATHKKEIAYRNKTELVVATVFVIRDWHEHFEVSQTRKVDTLRWVPVPVKHDGLSFRRVMALDDGLAVFGAWVLILQVAGKCRRRGILTTDTGRPMTAEDIAIKTGAPKAGIERALEVLMSEDVGWVGSIDSTELECESTQLDYRRGQDSTGQESASADSSAELGNGQASSVPSEFVFPTTGKGKAEWTLPQAKLDEYAQAYPGLDVKAEMSKARQWCRDKPRQRKTAGGMQAFLTSWLNRAQNRGPRDGGTPEKKADYRRVDPLIFKGHLDADEFLIRPYSDGKGLWRGQLRNGRKIETFVEPKKD